jgi:hypothetical protein
MCARACCTARKRPPEQITGGGAPNGAPNEYPLRRQSVAATAAARMWPFGPLAFRRSTAALARSLAALAQSGPALHGRGQPVRSPGSELLADRRRGRPGGFPNRPNAVCETARRHRTRSTFRIASGMCPWTSEIDSFSSSGRTRSRNSAGRIHPSDLMKVFSAVCLMLGRKDCDTPP